MWFPYLAKFSNSTAFKLETIQSTNIDLFLSKFRWIITKRAYRWKHPYLISIQNNQSRASIIYSMCKLIRIQFEEFDPEDWPWCGPCYDDSYLEYETTLTVVLLPTSLSYPMVGASSILNTQSAWSISFPKELCLIRPINQANNTEECHWSEKIKILWSYPLSELH